MAQQLVIDKVIIGSGISGASCFNWFAHHPSKQSVLLVDRVSSLSSQTVSSSASKEVSRPNHVITTGSMASGCWVTPTLPGADTQQITQLLADAHPYALSFYDRIGARGLALPWRLYRKESIPSDIWESKVPKWFDVRKKLDDRGEQIFECEGKEFRFFDDPGDVLSKIIQDALNTSPACRYMPGMCITRLEPVISKKRFGSKSSTHVQWTLHGFPISENAKVDSSKSPKERPLIRAKQVILATGADFLGEGPTSNVPELQYMYDSLRISRGSVIDLESPTSLFESTISQQNVVLSPLRTSSSPSDSSENDISSVASTSRARLGSTQRIAVGEEVDAAEEMLRLAFDAFPDLPKDAVITSIRTGERAYRANRLPIVGGLLDPFGAIKMYPKAVHGGSLPPSAPRLSGLYFIGGLGSRGYTLAPLLSRMLVEQLLGPFDTNAALGPSRILSKEASVDPGAASATPKQATFDDFYSGNLNEIIKARDNAADNLEELKTLWWPRFAPRKVLTAWLRRVRPHIGSATPTWPVNWPQLLNVSTPFPEDYHEAKDSFAVIPNSWDPNRAQFESTYCPLFDDDHTRD